MAITWNELRPDFSGANTAMRNAMTGFSQAGTVFGKIRESILAEEQRAVEAAYKQQVFDENVRQFEAQQLWNKEKAAADREHAFNMQKQQQDFTEKQDKARQQFEMTKIAEEFKNNQILEKLRNEGRLNVERLRIEHDTAEKNKPKERFNAAVDVASTAYRAAREQGMPIGEAVDIVNMALKGHGLSDVNIQPNQFVPVEDVNLYKTVSTPEYQAIKAAENKIAAGALAWDAKGKQENLDKYTKFYDRLVSGDDGTIGIIDELTERVRPLTSEEQAYFENNSNLTVAEQQRAAPELIKALRQEVINRGLDLPTAEVIGKRRLSAIGTEDIYKKEALARGADTAKVIPVNVANNAANVRKAMQAEEEAKAQAEKDAKTNSKSSTYSKYLVEFLSTYKQVGEDGKSTLSGMDDAAIKQALSTRDTFIRLGISADKYQEYLKILTNNLRYNASKGWYQLSGNSAQEYADSLINEVDKAKGSGNPGEQIEQNEEGKKKSGKDKKEPIKEKTVEEAQFEARAEWEKNKKLPTVDEVKEKQRKKDIVSLEYQQRQMEKVLKRTNLTAVQRADAEADLDSIKKKLKALRDQTKG